MFTKMARYYDDLYSFKDYAAEAAKVSDVVLRERPASRTLLDVACGTAEHAQHLAKSFTIDGIDLQPEFVEIARRKVPSGRFEVADMSDFDLGRRYDAVLCLFSSIGYLVDPAKVVAALACFARHINPGGIILVEPWFEPEQWKVGTVHMLNVDRPDLKICRMSVSERSGDLSISDMHYLLGTPKGVEHCMEHHELALHTRDEMLSFFGEAGLRVRHDPVGLSGRGLYIAEAR